MNFLLLFRAVCDALICAIQKSTTKSIPSMDQLNNWELSLEMLRELLEFAKESDIPKHFSLFLKVSFRSFIQLPNSRVEAVQRE